MSLQLAVQQIQQPSWWHEGEAKPTGRAVSEEIIARRKAILDYLRDAGRKVDAADIQHKFKLTNAKIWHALTPMINEGLIKKHKPRHDRSLLEAV